MFASSGVSQELLMRGGWSGLNLEWQAESTTIHTLQQQMLGEKLFRRARVQHFPALALSLYHLMVRYYAYDTISMRPINIEFDYTIYE